MITKLQQFCVEEKKRNLETYNFIASENYMSEYVSKFLSNVFLSSKYGEGYPGNRYYNGCNVIDEIENYTIELAKNLFNCEYANVQPHSGTQANMAVLFQLLKSEDTILSLNLNDGGHLSHGSKVSFSGKLFHVEHYFLDENYKLDYDHIRDRALQTHPKIIICGYSSYSGYIDFAKFASIAKEVGALLLSDISHVAGIIAANMWPVHPFPYSDIVTSTTHKTLRGPRGAIILCRDSDLAKNIDRGVFPVVQGGPFFNNIAAKAAAFEEASSIEFKDYITNVLHNSQIMCAVLQQQGWDTYCDPIHSCSELSCMLCDEAMKNRSHLFLLKTIDHSFNSVPLTGKMAANILEQSNIIVNKNAMPRESAKLTECSGIRIGVAAMTTRGMNDIQAAHIAMLISDVLHQKKSIDQVKQAVAQLKISHFND